MIVDRWIHFAGACAGAATPQFCVGDEEKLGHEVLKKAGVVEEEEGMSQGEVERLALTHSLN